MSPPYDPDHHQRWAPAFPERTWLWLSACATCGAPLGARCRARGKSPYPRTAHASRVRRIQHLCGKLLLDLVEQNRQMRLDLGGNNG